MNAVILGATSGENACLAWKQLSGSAGIDALQFGVDELHWFPMSTKEAPLGFTGLAQHIRNADDNCTFPDVDSFINSENIQLSSEIRGNVLAVMEARSPIANQERVPSEVWPAVPDPQTAKLEDLEAIFKSDGDSQRMEEAFSSVRSFIAEAKRIPEQLLRADDALTNIQTSKENLSELISNIESNMPK